MGDHEVTGFNKNCCGSNSCCPTPYYCKPPAPCFPSVCEVSKVQCFPEYKNKEDYIWNGGFNCRNPYGGYGAGAPPPCGLNFNASSCSPCCWDSTLCFPVPEECIPGEHVVKINNLSQAPQINDDVASALAIYNYSLQHVISRTLKFIASYYDWLYCQIGLYQWCENKPAGQDNENICNGPSAYDRQIRCNTPPQYYSSIRVNEERDGYVESLDETTQLNVPGLTQNLGGACFNPEDGGKCKPAVCLGINAGNAYTPPASLFAQIAQIFGWANTTFSEVDLANCVCNNLCQFVQMLINVDGSSGIRDFIKDVTFNSIGCNFQPTYLGCGNLYDEGKLVDFGDGFVSVVNLIIEVLNNMAPDTNGEIDPAAAEPLLQKLCCCLAKAAGRGTCAVGGCSSQSFNQANFSNFTFSHENPLDGCCNACPDINHVLTKLVKDILENQDDEIKIQGLQTEPCVIGYNNQIYRQQFFTMFVDLLQFILFDRDCNLPEKESSYDDCCCPAPPTQEEWLQARCRAGTGNGRCVVCSGACAQWRRSDDYKPLKSSLLAVKYAVQLLTLDRSDNPDDPTDTYAAHVKTIYQNIVSDYYGLYKGGNDVLVFHPDCAAPQFCCSTQLAADKCVYNCCLGICEQVPGCCLYPVPVLDTRKATWCCGQGVQYTPALGGCQDLICIDVGPRIERAINGTEGVIDVYCQDTDTVSNRSVEVDLIGQTKWDCYSNPCVIMPYCCKLKCDDCCCPCPPDCGVLS